MASQESNNTLYKFGQDEIDLKKYIHNLGLNVQPYLNSRNWSDGQKQEFMKAYDNLLKGFNEQLANNTNRFSTNDFGVITDTQGIISNQDNDDIDPIGSEYYYDNNGNRITTDDYNLLSDKKKKNYQTFSANREVAQYFNIIGQAIRKRLSQNQSTQSNSNSFDLSKNGFLSYWAKDNLIDPENADLTMYAELDQPDPNTGIRGTANRVTYLKEQLTNYLNGLKDYNYDFSQTPFKTRENYEQRLSEAISKLDNGYDPADNIALTRAGLTQSFLNNFFAIGQQSNNLTEKEQEYQDALKEIADREKEQGMQQVIDSNEQKKYELARKQYFDDFEKNNPFQSSVRGYTITPKYNYDQTIDYFARQDNPDALGDYIKNRRLNDYIRGEKYIQNGVDMTKEYISNNLDLAYNAGLLKDIGNGNYAIPGSENYDNWTFLQYNPKTRLYEEQSMLINENLRKAMAYDFYDKNNKVQSKEKGGILKFQSGGYSQGYYDFINKRKQKLQEKDKVYKQEIKQKAEEEGRTEEQIKAGQRKPQETGFTPIENARITSAIMDIGSIIASFVPGYGTGVSAGLGLASTGSNLYADIKDDSVSASQAAWNTLSGIGMDLVGLIPGLGALGKAGKIAKTLKYIIPTAITVWGAYENGTAPIKAANKLMNGETLSVDEWKDLSAGLQMLAGGVRAYRGNKAVNKIKNNKKAVPYNTITVKSGNTYKVTPEQYKKITSASTLDDQNKALREAIQNDTEELGSKFKTSKWERIRHFTIPEPKTSKGIDYENIDWTKQKRIPWSYKEKNGQIKPVRFSDEWFLEKTGNWTFKDPTFNLFTRKNPLYNQNFQDLRQWSRTPSWALKQNYGRDFGIGYPQKTKRELELGIEFDKQGGSLNLSNVRKFKDGQTITNTSSKADWFNDMYLSDPMQKWIGSYTLNDYEKFNDLQKSWSANKKATQYVPGATPIAWNQGVQDRQKLWEQTGTNSTIEDLATKGIITRPGNSGDNAEGGHVDGYFGEQEYLRHGGTRESWIGHEDDLIKLQNLLKEKGLQYTLDPETGMYLMSPIQNNSTQVSQTSSTSNNTNLYPLDNSQAEIQSDESDDKKVGQFSLSPTIMYGLPRALFADMMNRRITRLAKNATKPLLKDPFEVHRTVKSDLDAEMQGQRTYANLRSLATKPLTSQGEQQTATQLETQLKGQNAIRLGNEQSNKELRTSFESAWQQEKENSNNRHETAMFNRMQQWAAQQDKSKLDQAYLSKKHNIWDVLGQQVEYDARQKLEENKSLKDYFTRSDIHTALMYDPNKYGANLTNEELEVWSQVLSGVQPSTLLGQKQSLFLSARQKVSNAEQKQLMSYYNIPNSGWEANMNKLKQLYPETFNPTLQLKNGGSIALAGIRAKTADAKRFQKQIKECIDRNEKAIDRLSKSMYGLIRKIK